VKGEEWKRSVKNTKNWGKNKGYKKEPESLADVGGEGNMGEEDEFSSTAKKRGGGAVWDRGEGLAAKE